MSGEAKPGIMQNTTNKLVLGQSWWNQIQILHRQNYDFVISGALDATGNVSLGSPAETVDDG